MFTPREFGDKMAVSASPTSRSESGTSDSATSDSDGLVSKSRGTKSAVWIYFGFEADEEEDRRSRMP